jgi:exodeoxyribonuclease-3
LRIDHLLLSPSLGKRLIRAEVDSGVRGWDKASDHAPTGIELADAAQGDKARARRLRNERR